MQNNVSLAVLNSGDISQLSDEKQKEVLALKDKLELSNQGIMQFGIEASNKLNDFSTTILREVKVKDVPDISGLITDLTSAMDCVDTKTLLTKKPSLFNKIFHVEDYKAFIRKYDDVESVIIDIKNKMEESSLEMQKDIGILDNFIEQDKKYIDDLDSYILAGTLKKQEVEEILVSLKENLDETDTLAIQEINEYQNILERLDKKVYNLKLLREVAVQNIPQISIVRQGDFVSIDNLKTSIDVTIPMWESQIVLALAIARQKTVVDLQDAVTKTVNDMMKNNSSLVKSNAIKIAEQMERGIINIDTIQKTNDDLISTLNEVKRIREKGVVDRDNAIKAIEANQVKLAQAIVDQTTSGSTPLLGASTNSTTKLSELDEIRRDINNK